METMFLPNLSLSTILNGDVDSCAQRNMEIKYAVSKYIINTNNINKYFECSKKYHQSNYRVKMDFLLCLQTFQLS